MNKDEIEKLSQDQDMAVNSKKVSDADIKRKMFEMTLAREQRERQKMKQELLKRQVEEEKVSSLCACSRMIIHVCSGNYIHCACTVWYEA